MSKSINFVNPGFYFKRRRERINWRLLGSLDVDRIQRELDLSALQDAIDNVTFCDIESEDLRYTDPNFVKLFQLSQLIIEYLLYCQNLLQDTEKVSSKRLKELECEVEALKDQSEKQLLEIYTTKKENKSMKKTLYAYQMMSRYSGIPLSPTPPPFPLAPSNLPAFPPSVQTTNSHHRCPYCPKVFQNTPFLKAHVDRRHPEQPSRPSQNTTDDSLDYSSHLQTSSSNIQDPCLASPLKAPPTTTGSSISHEELEDEIKLRIQQQEKQQQLIERLQSTMLELEVKLSETEDQLKSDMENRLKSELDRRQRELDTTLESERASMQASLDALKNQLKTKIDHERALLETEKNTLESIRQSLLHPPPSQLGALEDDSPPPNQEELLHQFEESQARTVNAIQAFVADEIHQIRDLIHKEMEKKETQAETQFKSIQSAHFPEPSPAQESADPSPFSTVDEQSVSQQLKLKVQIPRAPPLEVESIQRRPSTRFHPPTIPHTDPVYKDDCDWEKISRHLRSHKHVSLPYAPWIKSAELHTVSQVVREREKQKVQLKQELTNRQITVEHLANENFFEQLVSYFEDQKEARHQSDLAYGYMYDFICEELERITAQQFKFRPKPTLMKKKMTVPHRPVATTKSTAKGVLKSPDKRSSVFRRVEWKEDPIESEETDGNESPTYGHRRSSAFASKAVHTTRALEPTTPDAFRSKSYIPKSFSPMTTTHPSSTPKMASNEDVYEKKEESHFKENSRPIPLPSQKSNANVPTNRATWDVSNGHPHSHPLKPPVSSSPWNATVETPQSPSAPTGFHSMKPSFVEGPPSQRGSANNLNGPNETKLKISEPIPIMSPAAMQTLAVKSHTNSNLSDWDVESL